MSENKINPMEDWSSEELSEAELDALAGGQTANFADLFLGDVQVLPPVEAKIDSSYTSYFGAIGTSGNENSTFLTKMPLNLTRTFP
jgi:hypothetical protein